MHSTIIRDYAILLVLLLILALTVGVGLRRMISDSLEQAIHSGETSKVKVGL